MLSFSVVSLWPLSLFVRLWVVILCDLMDSSPPGSSVHGIIQARILEWVAISFSRGSSQQGIESASPALAGGFFTTEPLGKPLIYNYTLIYIILEKKMATHSSILAWIIPWTEEPGRLQYIGRKSRTWLSAIFLYVRPWETKMISLREEYNVGKEIYKDINYTIMC